MAAPATATTRSTTAAVLMYVQGALAALGGFSLAFVADTGRRRFGRRWFHDRLIHHPGAWGVVLLLVAAALVAIGIGVYQRRSWAAPLAYAAEAVVGIGGMLGFHPLRSLLGLALAVAVILLVATDEPGTAPAGTG